MLRWLGAGFCLIGLAGCGDPLVVVQGRLAWNGQSWPANDQMSLLVTVTGNASEDGQTPGSSFAAAVAEDGTFTIHGATGKGIPPGRYTFSVRSTADGPKRPQPAWLANLADPATSPLKYEVTTDGSECLVLDAGKKTVAREP
jgi:hypothetical protein